MTIAKQVADNIFVSKEKSGVGRSNGIDEQLYSSAKRLLLQKIEFVNAKNSYSININKLKSKYTVLNGKNSLSSGICSSAKSLVNENDGIPNPRTMLFMGEKLELTWKKPMRVGAGLSNLGNTCFLNSALQCLTYTPPLANYLISCNHLAMCKMNGQFCMLCALQRHIQQTFKNVGQSIRPMSIIKNLRVIAKHLHFGRQEDAHEFIRYSIDAMQKACLSGHSSKLDIHTKATTLVYQIFGGYLRSRIKCRQCKAVSDTFDPFLDISLDINKQGCNDLRRCFEQFVKPDILQGNNSYKCSACKDSVSATKRFSIHRASNVLTIQLKRFSSFMGNKVNREVSYPSKLNLLPYMSTQQSGNQWYELYAVLVHSGFSCQSGHYYAYAKAPNGQWYCLNDSSVYQVGINQVLSQQAYLLFYHKTTPNKTLNGIIKAKTPVSHNNTPNKINDLSKAKPNYLKSTNGNNNIGYKSKQSNCVSSVQYNTTAIDKNKKIHRNSIAAPVKDKHAVLAVTDNKNIKVSSNLPTVIKVNHSQNETSKAVESTNEITSSDKVEVIQGKGKSKPQISDIVETEATESMKFLDLKPKISFKLNHTPILRNKQWQRCNQPKIGLNKGFSGLTGVRKRASSDDHSISSNDSRRSDKGKDSYLKKLKMLKQKLNDSGDCENLTEPKAKIQKIEASFSSEEKEIKSTETTNGNVVVPQKWDQKYVSHNKPKSKLVQNSNALKSLLNNSAGKGYGSSGVIKTWGGENSWVQEDAKRDAVERKHALKDDWDREYDRGQKKKVKKKFPKKYHDHSNLFQSFQNTKIKSSFY